ncbi:hypothetical protein CLOM_g13726, partial [Closterium sp. NIES-68]
LFGVDCGTDKKGADYIAKHLKTAIVEVGAENVVGLLMDGASANISAASIVAQEYPKVQWIRCAAHALSLLMKDIGELNWAKPTIEEAQQLISTLKNVQWITGHFREKDSLKVLKPAGTRFGTNYIALERLILVRRTLKKMVSTKGVKDYMKGRPKLRVARGTIKRPGFWKGVEQVVAVLKPIYMMLRQVDGNQEVMGKMYEMMIDLEEQVEKASVGLKADEQQEVAEIVRNRWENDINCPLYVVGRILYPPNQYEKIFGPDRECTKVFKQFVRDYYKGETVKMGNVLSPMATVVETEILTYTRGTGEIGEQKAKDEYILIKEGHLDPVQWWVMNGSDCPHLMKLACKILKQCVSASTCETNWGVWESIHTARRNRLGPKRLADLVYVSHNYHTVKKLNEDFAKKMMVTALPVIREEPKDGYEPLDEDDDIQDEAYLDISTVDESEDEPDDENLASNFISHSIPESLGNLSNLQYLFLDHNSLGATIPDSVSNLVYLLALDVSQNKLTGQLPPSMGSLTRLSELNISGTAITCPPDYSGCVVAQNASSAFCTQCRSFCTTCGSSESGGGLSVGAIAGIATGVGVLVLVLLLLGLLLCKRWRTKGTAARGDAEIAHQDTRTENKEPEAGWAAVSAAEAAGGGGVGQDMEARPDVCQEYSLAEMAEATSDWAEENIIGSGSFGDVYKGVCPYDCNQTWAVKRARVLTNDFHTEMKEMASKHHPHLVRLLGYCIDFDPSSRKMEQVLVYELMQNNNLETWIGPDVSNPLSLQQRLDILIGVARGLQYLHDFGIVHRDIKPANILLDARMQAKIADFGLVKLSGGTSMDTSSLAATRVMGTPGYVDPAYYMSHKATPAADVHSFGMVMLVIITARKAVHVTGDTQINLKQWVAPLITSNAVTALKDPHLDATDDLVLRLARLALSCTAMPSASRPAMSQVLVELGKVREEVLGAQANRAATRIDDEIDTSGREDFDAEIARAKNMGVSSGSSQSA